MLCWGMNAARACLVGGIRRAAPGPGWAPLGSRGLSSTSKPKDKLESEHVLRPKTLRLTKALAWGSSVVIGVYLIAAHEWRAPDGTKSSFADMDDIEQVRTTAHRTDQRPRRALPVSHRCMPSPAL